MPKVNQKPSMAPISRILDKKAGGETEILYPTPTPFDWNGKTYKIKPLTNRTLASLAGEFDEIIGLIARVAAARPARAESDAEDGEKKPEPPLTAAEFLPYIPEVLNILLPNATRVIADSLRVDEASIAEEMFLGKQLEALRLIIEANDFPLLFANFKRLTGLFTPPKASTEPNAEEMDETDEADEEAED